MKHIAKSVTWVGFLTLITAVILVLTACGGPDTTIVEPAQPEHDVTFWNTQADEASEEEREDCQSKFIRLNHEQYKSAQDVMVAAGEHCNP